MQHIALQWSKVCWARFFGWSLGIAMTLQCLLGLWDWRNTMRKLGYSVRSILPHDFRLLAIGSEVFWNICVHIYNHKWCMIMMSTEGELDAQLVERTVNGECEYCITNILIKICIHLNNVPLCCNHAFLCYSPPWSSCTFASVFSWSIMPLEEVFSEVKSIVKVNDETFRLYTQPRTLAFGMVTSEVCLGFIQKSRYIP